ncbi:TetR/AcrR family transcriptional regulator [Limosilactobacillus agrestimuris]|uniref:TetR/AcrR family transcriptional regulator n=1 Tax=Limosilactobacillus agrestimuris TaxID=2941331 RepID=UPI0020404337|nr:TetR/AcrR family transcriptional regulator [Limosilactobacillus agrestimuris]
MPSTTYQHLPKEKQLKIEAALLKEFSSHSLADAQVARIVKDAGIARGAFYKYFENIQTAYIYLYQQAVIEIHTGIVGKQKLSAEDYYQQVSSFVNVVNGSKYHEMMKLHFEINEQLVEIAGNRNLRPKSANEWAIMLLSHETIRECLEKPSQSVKLLKRYYQAIVPLTKEEN